MTPFPLGLDSPGPRLTSSVLDRSPARLMAIVAEHHLRGFARYQPRDVTGDGKPETWCNLFAQDVSEAMGAPLPRRTTANGLYAWLQSDDARVKGWEETTQHIAQRMADEGQLSLAVWLNVLGPGHIAVLVPSLGELGCWIAQAGATRFSRAQLRAGFGDLPVQFFSHP